MSRPSDDQGLGSSGPSHDELPFQELNEHFVRALIPGLVSPEHWHLELHDSLESTNRLAFRRGAEGAPAGLVVMADSQTGGRGRLQRTWFSPPGCNLYLSMLLRPTFPMARTPLVSLAGAVAVQRALADHGLETGIKWPNDLLVGKPSRKISGILAEMHIEPGRLCYVVLGIGVNLNVPEAGFPSELESSATSFLACTGKPIDRPAFAASLLNHMELAYGLLEGDRVPKLLQLWREKALTLGRRVRYQIRGAAVEGTARDIDSGGGLMVEGPGGHITTITAGDVSLVGAGEQTG